jgi:hypothetical protein
VLQAHTQEWLGSFAGAGNGDFIADLEAACLAVAAYLRAKELSPSQALLRLDGLYGSSVSLARVQYAGLGFVVRGREYRLLDHPVVRERLARPSDGTVTHPETGVCRELFDVGYLTEWLEPGPERKLTCRIIVTRRAPDEAAVGKLRDGQLHELFLTSHPADRLTAADVLDLYNQRGSFEQVLADEDAEQAADRWCSRRPAGQAFWQVLNQWAWNTRLALGHVAQARPPRWTRWSDGQPATPPAPPPVTDAPVEEEVVSRYGPLERARVWAKARGRFSGQDFEPLDDGTPRCPAGHGLRVRQRRELLNGDLRIMNSARDGDCRACDLKARCLGQGASGLTARRVSATRKLLGRYARPKQPAWQFTPGSNGAPEAGPCDVIWCDVGGRRLRRDLVRLLRRQAVTLEAPSGGVPPAAPPAAPRRWTRAERAHRRLSWDARLMRNARAADEPRWRVTLFGIAPRLADFLDLPTESLG